MIVYISDHKFYHKTPRMDKHLKKTLKNSEIPNELTKKSVVFQCTNDKWLELFRLWLLQELKSIVLYEYCKKYKLGSVLVIYNKL